MAYIGKTLATGWAKAFTDLIFDVPASTVIKQLHFTNTTDFSTSVSVYHRDSEKDDWVLWFQNPSIGAQELWTPLGTEGDVPLSAGNQIGMRAGNELEIYYRILGAEFT